MTGFESVFQRMDETIADVCLRELSWDHQSLLWLDGGPDSARQRVSEVYRMGRPLILHLIKTDKSPIKNLKKLSIARSMMDAGKKTLETNAPLDALNMYNKAVVFSPNIDDNLAKACADRAACLLRLGDYKRALTDIEQAQQAEYQFERRFELEERKGLAYAGLQQFDKAKESFTLAISLLEDAAGFLHKKFVDRKMLELRENLNSCCLTGCRIPPAGNPSTADSGGKFQNMKKLAELRVRNRKYPALSDKVEVRCSGGNRVSGQRELVTTRDLAAGEILGVEKPIASCLEKEYVKTNCWHCLVTLKAPYGCPLCSAVKFCSKECLKEACSTYHPSECLLTDLVMSNQIAASSLAFRAISSRPLKQNMMVGRNNCSSSAPPPVYASQDLSNLLHFPVPRLTSVNPEEVKKKSVMAVFYLILLQMTGYFDTTDGTGRANPSLSSIYQMKGKENDSSLSEEEMHIATLLDQIITNTAFCTTEVCHFEMDGSSEWTAGKVTPVIGKTINPTLALVSHSCYPTAARVCHENRTLLIAQKNIKPGEAITINYSAPFYAATRSDRQQYLTSGYVLRCECDACQQDWPMFDSLPAGPAALAEPDTGSSAGLDLPNGIRPVNFNSGPDNGNNCNAMPVMGIQSTPLSQTERSVIETFNRVRGRIEQLQRSRVPGDPPTKIMIQNQVRLFRCLLAMYSSKLYIVKTGYGTLPVPV